MMGDEEFYERALQEVQQEKVDPITWEQAQKQAKGNRHMTIALYVGLRVRQAEGIDQSPDLDTLPCCGWDLPAKNTTTGCPDNDNSRTEGQDSVRMRLMARFVDQGIGWLVLLIFLFLCNPLNTDPHASGFFVTLLGRFHGTPGHRLQILALLTVLGAPLMMLVIDTALYALFGNTPGKALFGVCVCRAGHRLSPLHYGLRNLYLWVLGIGMGIPILGLIMVAWQYFRLRDGRDTLYDHIAHCTVSCSQHLADSNSVSAA